MRLFAIYYLHKRVSLQIINDTANVLALTKIFVAIVVISRV